MVLNIVYMMFKLCNARHHMHDTSSITLPSQSIHLGGSRTGHLSLNPLLRSYLDPVRDLLRQVALSARKNLFSLKIFSSPTQMADSQEEQLNVQTLSTNGNVMKKKEWQDIIQIYDAWLNRMALHISHILWLAKKDGIA